MDRRAESVRFHRFTRYKVADPRVAELVLLARAVSADNVAALSECIELLGHHAHL